MIAWLVYGDSQRPSFIRLSVRWLLARAIRREHEFFIGSPKTRKQWDTRTTWWLFSGQRNVFSRANRAPCSSNEPLTPHTGHGSVITCHKFHRECAYI